ncbi:MAG TPA: Holliday junction branch migration protein RuvA [Candidatus Nitrosotenuis sp.]|nr:Holliday junction branch migration protein RuvA [Candidatus Nitrosotenuis sp.]
MIAHLRGVVEHVSPDLVVLDVGGVGYAVHLPGSVAEALSPGQKAHLYTCLLQREDEPVLYGFSGPQQRELFRMLLSISGIGPRLALKVLSVLTPAALAQAILDQDVATLTRIPGVGQRTARRLLLELSEKIAALAPEAARGQPAEEAEAVLISLGCTRQEARQALREACARGSGLSVEQLVMEAMKVLGEGRGQAPREDPGA